MVERDDRPTLCTCICNFDYFHICECPEIITRMRFLHLQVGSRDGRSNTLETVDPMYQHNIGQRVGLSFLTSKLINFAYCNGKYVKTFTKKRSLANTST